jgi:hypothetical protein
VKELGQKLCLFLFLVSILSGRTNELGTLTGAVTGTFLFWPLYRKLIPSPVLRPRRRVVVEEEPAEAIAE